MNFYLLCAWISCGQAFVTRMSARSHGAHVGFIFWGNWALSPLAVIIGSLNLIWLNLLLSHSSDLNEHAISLRGLLCDWVLPHRPLWLAQDKTLFGSTFCYLTVVIWSSTQFCVKTYYGGGTGRQCSSPSSLLDNIWKKIQKSALILNRSSPRADNLYLFINA